MFRRPLDGSCSPLGAHVRARKTGSTLSGATCSTRHATVHHPFRFLNGGWPRSLGDRLSAFTACSPSRCLCLRPSCDVHVQSRFWGPSVVRPPAFAKRRPSALSLSRSRPRAPGRVHLLRVYRARLSTITGNTPSAHSPRAREFVSRFDESQRRSSSFRRSRPHLAPGCCACPPLSAMAFAQP